MVPKAKANIEVQESNAILTITLSRPDRLNILDLETRKEILRVLETYESNREIRCLLLTARGEVFSAGADIRYLLSLDNKASREYAGFVRSFLTYVESYPKPVVGAVNGTAVGGGLELLLVLDIVVASSEARFGQTELNVGLIPGGGGSQRLPRLIGVRKAKEMIYTGGLLSAEEALRLGLVNIVVEKERLMEEALSVCERVRSKSPMALKLAKRAINSALSMSLQDGLAFESELYSKILSSRDAKEGLRAFLEKRQPQYIGDGIG
ncbi:MAG: enoyl-CoA hydratase/isomerase family protein [Thaumarchaeota archaeon]|nr:MAG: enoyl-CoA hydratase/isomerase family protein [Nitrososphaerota archaeon]